MSADDVEAFLEFMRVERSASERTLRNYSHALNAYLEWRGEEFVSWRACTADDFRLYLFELMKQAWGESAGGCAAPQAG